MVGKEATNEVAAVTVNKETNLPPQSIPESIATLFVKLNLN
jgi:hypothetical protein